MSLSHKTHLHRDVDLKELESQRRTAYDQSKWLQTCTYQTACYEYNDEELNQFFDELLDIIGRVKAKFTCHLCNNFPKKSFILPCGHNFCARCASRGWNQEKQSICPKCKAVHEERATSFFAMNTIVEDISLFTKEAKYFQNASSGRALNGHEESQSQAALKRLKSMNFVLLKRIKNIESQLMCDFCFYRLKKTHLVNCSSNASTFRPLCGGCDAKYISFYEKELGWQSRNSFKFEPFDLVVNEFYEFFDKLVEYSKTSKTPTRFMSANPTFNFIPVYKMLAGFAIIGVIMLYYST